MVSGHFVEKCKECGVVISQCRCFDCNKQLILSVCDKCKEKRLKVIKCNLDLDDFCESVFHYLEDVQDGGNGHIVMFKGNTKLDVANKIAEKLVPFILDKLEED